ncbi:MAG: hypothetical protein Q8Q39_01995 [bacterium]|nr:hypothetical protein [bacterium]
MNRHELSLYELGGTFVPENRTEGRSIASLAYLGDDRVDEMTFAESFDRGVGRIRNEGCWVRPDKTRKSKRGRKVRGRPQPFVRLEDLTEDDITEPSEIDPTLDIDFATREQIFSAVIKNPELFGVAFRMITEIRHDAYYDLPRLAEAVARRIGNDAVIQQLRRTGITFRSSSCTALEDLERRSARERAKRNGNGQKNRLGVAERTLEALGLVATEAVAC